jgi:type II secretion system protein C
MRKIHWVLVIFGALHVFQVLWAADFVNAPKSHLDLVLIGTIVHTEKSKSIASINSNAYRTGYGIQDVAILREVERFKAYVFNKETQKVEFITTGPYDPKQAVTKSIFDKKDLTFQIKRDTIDKVTANLPLFLQEASSAPVKDSSGKIIGFQLTWIKPGGVFDHLGLRSGDTLQSVNDLKLDSFDGVMRIYQQLKDSSLIDLNIERQGQVRTIRYLVR